jgi:hypothetical protein
MTGQSSSVHMPTLTSTRFDRLKRAAQFLSQTRSTFILHAFGTGLMLLSAFIVTISGMYGSFLTDE